MPGSAWEGKHWMLNQIRRLNPRTVLDVGAGEGTYLELAHRRGQHWTAVEAWEPYVSEYQLAERYDRVIVGDVRSIEWPDVDLVIFGDVLEHMTHADALQVWNESRKHARHVLLSLPIIPYPQGPIGGNPYEEHRSTWMHGECVALPGVIASRKQSSMGCYLAEGSSDVSIIVTTCDRQKWLTECLRSLPDHARLVIDNDWAHSGTSAARMRGLAHAESLGSPFFAFFDDDDVMLPNWLPLHLAKMSEGYDVVGSAHWETDANLNRQTLVTPPVPTMADLLECRVTISDNALIRRSVLDGVTWHPERENVMMLSLWLALAAKGARFAMIDEPTWLYRRHDRNQSSALYGDERDAEFRRIAVAEYR